MYEHSILLSVKFIVVKLLRNSPPEHNLCAMTKISIKTITDPNCSLLPSKHLDTFPASVAFQLPTCSSGDIKFHRDIYLFLQISPMKKKKGEVKRKNDVGDGEEEDETHEMRFV